VDAFRAAVGQIGVQTLARQNTSSYSSLYSTVVPPTSQPVLLCRTAIARASWAGAVSGQQSWCLPDVGETMAFPDVVGSAS
jgi:hypothetical protein